MEKFAGKIIDTGKIHLRKQEKDFSVRDRKIGIPFPKKEYEKVRENLEEINNFGKGENVKISKMAYSDKGIPYIFFEYIDPEKKTKK
mgnify:FL=1